MPVLMLAVVLICPTVKGGGSQAIGTTPLCSFRRGMSMDITGPGRGVGANVDGLAISPIVSSPSSSTVTAGACVPSPMAVTCSSNVPVAPASSGGKLKVRRPSSSV